VTRAWLGLALAAALGLACGKYGPPVRAVSEKPAKTPPVAAAPAASSNADAEQCEEPKP
jgi:hypothetical protein